MTDQEIITMFNERSEEGIKALNEKYYPYCYKIAMNILSNIEDAKECINDMLMKTWHSIPPNQPNNLSAYIGKITRNLAIDSYRKKGRIPIVVNELETCVPSPIKEEMDLVPIINDFLQEEKEIKRIIFVKRYFYCENVRDIALALSDLPVIGSFIEVITIRTYDYHDEEKDIHVEIPALTEDHQALNDSVESYLQMIIDQVPDTKILVDSKYEVITNSDTWFTLVLTTTEIQASGYSYNQYYHIDKSSNTLVHLSDLFSDEKYMDTISEFIRTEMTARMAEDESLVYFVDTFEGIEKNHSFYFNEDHNMVIVFNEYDIAPGYMGIVEFVIPSDLLEIHN